MDRRQIQQQDLSETLSLLESTNYQYPEAVTSNVDERTKESNKELRFLDIIALCIVTGQAGDVVASGFMGKTIYLSKNGEPTQKDMNHAQNFMRALQASKHQSMLDILPCIASHSAAMVQHRVDKLQYLVDEDKNKDFREYLNLQIKNYNNPVRRSIASEFPGLVSAEYLKLEGYEPQREIDSSTIRAILKGIFKKFDASLIFDRQRSSHLRLQSLVFAGATLRRSMFFRELTQSLESDSTAKIPTQKLSKFCRNVNKVCQYIRIIDLITYIQENGPFKIEWVCEVNMNKTLCYEFQGLKLRSASAVATSIANTLQLKPLKPQELTEGFQRMNPFLGHSKKKPTAERYVDTYVHAELKLIVFLLSRVQQVPQYQRTEHYPIGCSKRSCLYCTLWIEELQGILNSTRRIYYTAGSHGSPYATCAQVGPFKLDPTGLCSSKVQSRLKNLAKNQVEVMYKLKPGHIKNKHSEDYASASDVESTSEKEPDRSLRKIAAA